MSAVELVVTEARIWAVGPATHWDVPPSVVLGGDGGLVVGASLTPPTQVSSVVQYVSADRIALVPTVPTVVEALSMVAATVLENLRVPIPAARVTVVCPTEWGGYRRAVVDRALRRVAAEVSFEDTAVRAVAADEEAARGRRAVVLEFGAITTTASSVAPAPHGLELESCEFEPDLAGSDLADDPEAARTLGTLLGGLLLGRPVDVVLVLGLTDSVALDVVRAEVRLICGSETALRPMSGSDLVRPVRPEPELRPAPAAAPATEWLRPLRERAAAQRDPRERRAAYLLGGAAAAVVIAAAAIGTAMVTGGSGEEGAEMSAAPSSAPAAVSPTADLPAPSVSAAPEVLGRTRFQVPEDWMAAPAPGNARIELSPVDGAKQRIVLTQNTVAANAGYEQVAANLEAQMRQRPAMSDLRRDVVFGGRSMLAYTERPEGGSTVKWHVLVEHGTQVSIGCQYLGDAWEALATTCDRFAASVRVMP
ncbi:type VII secretion-associated protein [Nocardia arizonensis]|uniref:type VII secretion-associated protein n=1 Tax=Nocardia arizonensis TaxID=1141647 RepID=UPI0006CF9379|nr:type VII secretion-associated protein [Nocardia arizonensis]